MDWRVVLGRYLWAVVFREAMCSRRWSGEAKFNLLMTVGLGTALILTVLDLLWLLTGRASRLRHALGQDIILAFPQSKGAPNLVKDVLEKQLVEEGHWLYRRR